MVEVKLPFVTITPDRLINGQRVYLIKHRRTGVATQGDNILDALKNIKEAVSLYKSVTKNNTHS